MEIITKSPEETALVAENILRIVKENKKEGAAVLALFGDLGAGKTSFSQSLGKILGVKEGMQSPTFLIQKTYDTTDSVFKKFTHIDAYRLDRPEEILPLGWNELIEKKDEIIAVEWPEKIKPLLPKNIFPIHFEFISENERKITYEENN